MMRCTPSEVHRRSFLGRNGEGFRYWPSFTCPWRKSDSIRWSKNRTCPLMKLSKSSWLVGMVSRTVKRSESTKTPLCVGFPGTLMFAVPILRTSDRSPGSTRNCNRSASFEASPMFRDRYPQRVTRFFGVRATRPRQQYPRRECSARFDDPLCVPDQLEVQTTLSARIQRRFRRSVSRSRQHLVP